MRIRISTVIFCLLSTLAIPCHGADNAPTIDDLIIWEIQDWKSTGGHKRLTLWRDGYSEIEVVLPDDAKTPSPSAGWERIRENDKIRYVHRNAYTPDATRKMFRQAIRAGIRRLSSFHPVKKDAGGTRVVVSLDGERKELIIPDFLGRYNGNTNHRRFQAVSAILGHFNSNPFAVPGAKPKPTKPVTVSDPAAAPTTTETTDSAATEPAERVESSAPQNEPATQETPPAAAAE